MVLFAEVDGKTVGWFPGIPNLNEAFIHANGLRYPWDYLKLMRHIRKRPKCLAIKSVLILPQYWGGGVALLRAVGAVSKLELEGEERIGVDIVARSLEEPLRTIAANAGSEGSVVVEQVKKLKAAMGFNAAMNQYEDLVKVGIVDPTKVARSALQNAASIAALLLTTEAIVCDKPEEDKAPAMPGGGMGGGMPPY